MKGLFYIRLENQFEDGFQLKMQLTGFKSQKESKTLQGERERERRSGKNGSQQVPGIDSIIRVARHQHNMKTSNRLVRERESKREFLSEKEKSDCNRACESFDIHSNS